MTDTPAPISVQPGDWLGMLGGGQLGRMFCHAAQRMGYRVAVLDPDTDSPAGAVADLHIQSAYSDTAGLEQLAQRCAAITTEFENVPAGTLATLSVHSQVRPGAGSVAITQDRIREKAFFVEAAAPVAPYADIRTLDDIRNAPDELYPGILKVARFGYDGNGQARVRNRSEASEAFHDFEQAECVLEALMPLENEVSIVLARDHEGNVVCYPPIYNEHRDGVLAVSRAGFPDEQATLTQQAVQIATRIARQLDYVGVLCVEFFVLQDGRLIVNEMAPRPHNSGHYTMDASISSQFEQQVRVLAGMPLGAADSVRPAIMLNILGDVWFAGGAEKPSEPAWDQVLAITGAHLHLYGKKAVRAGRKMGHVTIVGATPGQTCDAAVRVARLLRIPFQP